MRKLISAKGLSLREFARAYGFHYSLVSRVVAGEANLTLLQLQKFALALNTRPERLLT